MDLDAEEQPQISLYVGIHDHLATFQVMRQTLGHGHAAARDAEGHVGDSERGFGRAGLPQGAYPKVFAISIRDVQRDGSDSSQLRFLTTN